MQIREITERRLILYNPKHFDPSLVTTTWNVNSAILIIVPSFKCNNELFIAPQLFLVLLLLLGNEYFYIKVVEMSNP